MVRWRHSLSLPVINGACFFAFCCNFSLFRGTRAHATWRQTWATGPSLSFPFGLLATEILARAVTKKRAARIYCIDYRLGKVITNITAAAESRRPLSTRPLPKCQRHFHSHKKGCAPMRAQALILHQKNSHPKFQTKSEEFFLTHQKYPWKQIFVCF